MKFIQLFRCNIPLLASKQLLRVMRIFILLMTVFLIQVSAATKAQQLTIKGNNLSLREVITEIRKQTGYTVLAKSTIVNRVQNLNLDLKNVGLEDALTKILKSTNLEYSINEKAIFIKEVEKSFIDQLINRLSAIDITGIIADENGKPIPGATIKVKGTSMVTNSNNEGIFILKNVEERAILEIIYLGYKTKELRAEKQLGTISLEISIDKLDEVQVIGYGTTTQRLNTGSISRISAKEISQQPVTNVLSALSGRMPGVFVQTTNGLPGGNINIQIRGKGSLLAGTDPLYVIDGVPYDGTAVGKGNTDANNIAGAISPLNNLNPSDIETISVLKDADATSIYGSRGTNGVVLITTKTAKTGATKLDINFRQGFSTIAAKPNLLDLTGYLQMRREAFANDKLIPSSDPLSATYAPDLTVWSQSESTDWTKYILGNTANSTDLQSRISGGKGNTTFFVNGSYRKEGAMLLGFNTFTRAGASSQIMHKSEDNKFNATMTTQFSKQFNDLSNLITNIHRSFLSAPNYPLYNDAGGVNWTASNPLAESKARSKNNVDNLLLNMNLAYSLLPNLKFKINSGYTKTAYDQTFIFPTSALAPGNINNSIFMKTGSQSFIVEPQFDYNLTLGKSKVSFLAGGTYQNRTNFTQKVLANNFTLESLMENLGSAATITANSTDGQYKYVSLFARMTYNLSDTYVINGTVRRDGSSRFGPGNRYGNFGSVGAAWIFSNLSAVRSSLGFLSYGKIHASYGSTGNDQIQDYGYLSTYSSPGSTVYQGTSVIRPSRISNFDFHWEVSNKADIGIELGLFKERIFLSADYYNNQSVDQLVSYALPQSTGFASYQANLPAVIQNRGWEFSVDGKIFNNRKFSWSTNFNITFLKNKLKSFDDFETSSYASSFELGYDITRIIGYKSVGINPLTGKVQYAGRDGLPSITPEFNNTLGKVSPDFFGGMGNTIAIGNFELSIFTQFVKQISRGGLSRNAGSGIGNTFDLDRWSVTNPNSTIPAASTAFDSRLNQSSVNIFDTSFIRVKNISCSYKVPSAWINKLKLSSLSLYAEGQNLFTFWDKNAAVMDPESGAVSTLYGRNIPPVKTFSLGFQLTF